MMKHLNSVPDTNTLSDFSPNSLPALLDETIAQYGDCNWLAYGAQSWTFAESGRIIESLAAIFEDYGLGYSDRIILLMPNHPGFVWSYYAALRIGATVVALNPLYPADRLQSQIAEAQPLLIVGVTLEAEKEKVADIAARMNLETYFWSWEGTPLERQTADLIADERIAQSADIEPETTLAALQGTGGTTGIPKFAMLSHANLRWNAEQAYSWFYNLEPGKDRLLVPVPLCHITGMTIGMNLSVRAAAETVLIPRFRPEQIFEIMKEKPVSMIAGVPTIFTALLQHPQSTEMDWSKVKYAGAGGAPVAAETIRRFHKLSGLRIMQCYGLSEASPLVTMMPGWPDEPLEAAGLPVPGTDITIDGNSERGEILVRGPQVMSGYWNRPDETTETLRDGVLHTGDMGFIDERGFLHIVDRMKEIIIASGYNIFPRPVEDAIMTHPKVVEAAVIGAPDDYRGETIRAYVVLHPREELSLEELQAYLNGRLSAIEMPKQLEIRADLPLTPVGKPSRAALRKELAESRRTI